MANLIKTPHPVTLEGQERIAVELRPGESLFSLLNRTLGDQLDGEMWNVTVGGVEVPMHDWHTCYPKNGQLIEVVGDMGRSALMMVAIIALTIWTGGMFAAVAAGGTIGGLGAVASYAVVAGIQVAGSLLINKVLGPKPPGSPDNSQGPEAHSLNSTQNQPRNYGAVPVLFGRQRFGPDLLSKTYSYFDRDDMYLAMHVAWGIGVGRVANIRNGDTLLSDYDENVTTYQSGFSEIPDQEIPLFGNTDTQPGGSLQQEKVPLEVVRTTSTGTVRIMANISGSLYGVTRKGKLSMNQETFELSYRPAGTAGWVVGISRPMTNDDRRTLRFTMIQDVPAGQYDVRVRRMGRQSTGDGDVCEFSYDTMVSVQEDTSTYRGIARTGITLRANERLSGQPTEINGEAVASPIPVWNGTAWVTEETSNPGAQMLKYLRGYYDREGVLVAGLGEADDAIDLEAFKAFMVHCRDREFSYNFWLAKDRDHLESLNSIASAGMGQFTDANGLYSVVWVAEEQPVDATINMARIKKGTFRVDYSLTGTADGVIARYWDAIINAEATLRVPMPGVTTMLSPATITLEGVTNEAQAAILARYYLAQSLYQFKDVSFGTSLENLTFRRLSLLQVSHDMTQWGYSGVVVRAEATGNAVQLWLDEPVPPPAQGRQAYIGVRVPGQRAASVFKVKPFLEETRKLELAEPWPSDIKLPGDSNGNPAHDSIWIYDFKETPGLTARVVNIARAVDHSATVNVVQESAQFWTYVNTGHYEPANGGSLLATRPTVSSLEVVEQRNVTGDVIQDTLVVSFEVSGPYDESRIYTVESDGSLRERVRTNSRSAEFNIPGPGTYTVMVVPYNRQGLRGRGMSKTYSTLQAGAPPVLVDTFDVEELPGGIRRYTYGFYPDTIQSADFAGVEIRMTQTDVLEPDWDHMEQLGAGFFTSSVDLVLPPKGTYTFAIRSRNTGGILSDGIKFLKKTLKANLGEVITEVISGVEQNQTDLAKEINDRINDVNAARDKAAQELADKAAALSSDIQANADKLTQQATQLQEQANSIRANTDGLAQEQIDRIAGDLKTATELGTAITEEKTIRESEIENLALQISMLSAGAGNEFDSLRIWHFDTDGEGWNGVSVDGYLSTGNPWAISADNLDLPVAGYRYIKMRLWRRGEPGWQGRVEWTLMDGTVGTANMVEPTWDANNHGIAELENIQWGSNANLKQLRIRPGTQESGSDEYRYDYIGVGRPAPGASVAMVKAEEAARISADSAEATKRETLAVQMRGSYEGSDVAGVQAGLIGSEKTARIEGDAVLARDITTLQSRMPTGDGKVASQADLTALRETNASEHSAISQRIDTLNSQMGDKASAAALEALKAEVTQVDGKTTANAQNITDLTATVNGVMTMGDNHVLNGSFELGKDIGWAWGGAGTSIWSGNEGRNGGACWKAGPQAGGAVRLIKANKGVVIPATPGQKYRISAWYRTDAFNGTAGQSKLRLGDQNGGILIDFPFTGVDRPEWAYAERIYVVPTSGNVKGFTLEAWRDGDAGNLWLDDVAIENVTDFLANAEAVTGLTVKVTEVEGGVKANTEQLTQMSSSIGNVTNYTVIASSSISAQPSGAPKGSGVYRADGSIISGLGALRGIRVARINGSNGFYETQLFDIYTDAANNAKRFNDWYDALPADEWFLLYSSDHVGNFSGAVNPDIVGMRARMMDGGMLQSNSEKFTATQMFAMVGRKGMGMGGALQQLSREPYDSVNPRKGCWVSLQFALMNGVPLGVGDGRFTDLLTKANATAITGLTTDVSSINGKVDAQAQLLTQLRTDVNDVTSKTAANTTAVQQLTTRTTTVEGKVETMGTAVTKLTSEMTSIGGDNLLKNSSMEISPNNDSSPTFWNLERIGAQINTRLSYVPSPLSGGGRAHRIDWTANALRDWAGCNLAGPVVNYLTVDANTDYVLSSWVRGTVGSDLVLYVQWMDNAGTIQGTITLPTAKATGAWQRLILPARSRGDTTRARVYIGRQFANALGAHFIEVDNVAFQRGLVATEYQPSGQEVMNSSYAQADAITGLTTKVDKNGQDITAQADQLTQLTTTIEATFNRGDNLNANAIFDNTMEPFRKGNTSATNGDVTWISGAGQLGSAIQFVHKVGAGASPYVVANVGRWSPIKAGKGRKLRTVIVARVVDGAATLTARCRVRTLGVAGEGNNDQTTPNLTTAWQRFALEHPIGDERTDAMSQVWVTNRGTTDCRVLVDRIEFYDITDELAITGNATAITGLTTQVTQQGQKLDATAQDMTQLKAQVGDMNATAFNQLKTQVTQDGQDIQANATAIQGVQAGLAGKASADVVVAMEATVKNLGESGNLLQNSTFPFWNRSGWAWGNNDRWSELGDPTGDAAWNPKGVFGLGARSGPVPDQHTAMMGTTYDCAVIAGKDYCFSVYLQTHRVDSMIEIAFYNQQSQYVGSQYGQWVSQNGAGPANGLAGIPRSFVIGRAPAGAAFARVNVFLRGTSASVTTGPYFWIFRPMLSQVAPGTTQPPAWSAGGQESNASWSVNVRADGKVGGIQLASAGTISSFDVLADVFRVSAPNGGQRTEYSDGNWRVYDGAGRLRTRMGVW